MPRKITTEIFRNELKNINPNIDILGQYLKAKQPIKCQCKICGYKWEPTPSNLRKGRGCPKCSKRYVRNEDDVREELHLMNPNIKIVGKYINTQAKLKVQCLVCGHQWQPVANSLLSQHTGCPECKKKTIAEKNRLSEKEIVLRMKERHPEVEILGNIKDTKTTVTCKCTVCGNIWNAKYTSLRNSAGCPKCMHQEALSDDEFKRRVKLLNPAIKILGSYTRQKDPVLCICKKCGYKWNGIPSNLMQGEGCRKCAIDRNSKAQRKTTEDYIREMKEKNDTLVIKSDYVNAKTLIKYQCKICGYEGQCKPFALLNGQGCSNCNHKSVSFAECFIATAFAHVLGAGEVIRRNRKVIGKELDILVLNRKLAIEPGSWFWHKNKVENDKEKQKLCREKGIKLIIIYSDYLLDTPPIDENCWVYKDDFSRDKKHECLKKIIDCLFEVADIKYDFSEEEWKQIEKIAYIDSRAVTTEKFIERVSPQLKNYKIVGEYVSTQKRISCECLKCGLKWTPLAGDLLYNNAACPKCAGILRKTQEEFVKEVEMKNPTVKIVGQYVNRKTAIECRCEICGKDFKRIPANILVGAGCPVCKRRGVNI